VEGATKGDALAVRIDSIKPRGPQPRGTCCLIPYFGGLTGTDFTATLQDPLPDLVRKVHITEEEGTRWNDRITFPYEPFIRSIGSARPMEDAARIAFADLVTWMVSKFGFEKFDAYFILSQVGKVRLANMVDPNYTIGASIAKSYLPK